MVNDRLLHNHTKNIFKKNNYKTKHFLKFSVKLFFSNEHFQAYISCIN